MASDLAHPDLKHPGGRKVVRETSAAPVRRRRVFFICGFDPRGPAFYHRGFIKEAAKHSALTGEQIEVGTQETRSAVSDGWIVGFGAGTERVELNYEFLRWDDIVGNHWTTNPARLWAITLWGSWTLWRRGVFRAVAAVAPRFAAAMSVPGLLVTSASLLMLAAAAAFGVVFPRLLDWPWWSGVLLALAAVAAVYASVQELDRRFKVLWGGRWVAFISPLAQDRIAGFQRRLDELADHLLASCRKHDADEILVIGHSLGGMLATSVILRAYERDPEFAGMRSRVAVLELGPATPLISVQPEAEWLRSELRRMADCDVTWFQICSPIDPLCFPFVDPVALALSGNPQSAAAGGPKIVDARFKQVIDPAKYATFKRDHVRTHIQYVLASDRLGGYDYFGILGGSLRLEERYGSRAASTTR
jgi:hypothetical protein